MRDSTVFSNKSSFLFFGLKSSLKFSESRRKRCQPSAMKLVFENCLKDILKTIFVLFPFRKNYFSEKKEHL